MPKLSKKAVVLLSGGLDSATTLAIAIEEGFKCYPLTFAYQQRHKLEVQNAIKICKALKVRRPKVAKINLAQFGGSALTDKKIAVPKDRQSNGRNTDIPITYVPARNLIFLSLALAYAEICGAFDIFIGVNAMDYSGYPDCRGEFISSFQQTANLAVAASVQGRGNFTIHTPILNMTKDEIIKQGVALGVDYSLTHSCYDPDENGRACGHCDSCKIRLGGFEKAQIKDPVEYM